MKQRFSSLDVKVIAHELSATLVSLRLSNIYDLSSKILLLKFAKPEEKRQLLIDSGFRCHLTDFARTTAAAPSVFVQKLRKVLKTRRLTAVFQIGTDRIIEFRFSDGQYRLYLEFFAGGNVILTDNELKILTLLRHVPEGEGQEPQRPGLTYSLENRQNFGGVPELTKERLRTALGLVVERNAAAITAGKKMKKKPGDELRKGLAMNMPEFPPILIDHTMKVTSFDSTIQPAAVLEDEGLLDHLLRALGEAQRIIANITSSGTCKGYIIAKQRLDCRDETAGAKDAKQKETSGLMYDDFHPFLPRQFEENPTCKILSFDNFNKTVDEFFSSIEGQRLESKLTEREAAAKRKLEAARKDQTKRIEGLQTTQQLNVRKAAAIEANVERVEEAMDAVNGLIAQGMDWVDIGKLIAREHTRNNPVATIISLPLKLGDNTITLLLGEAEDEEEENEADETDSDSDSDESDEGFAGTEIHKQKAPDRRLAIDINLGITPWANAREYYEEKKSAATKEEKTLKQSEMAFKSAEQKIAIELKKGLKQEKPVLQPIRRQMWFEKFTWFISSDGYLVIAGRDATQNEMMYRRHLSKGDIYVHAELHGAPSVIVMNNPKTPDAPIPPSTLSQAGSLAVCSSSAWESKAAMSAYWVTADQVSKQAPTGEFLPTGSFLIRGKKNFLPPATLLLGFGILFRISEESKARHVKHRLHDADEQPFVAPLVDESATSTALAGEEDDTLVASDTERGDSDAEDDAAEAQNNDADRRQNPLQATRRQDFEDEGVIMEESEPSEQMKELEIYDKIIQPDTAEDEHQDEDTAKEGEDDEEHNHKSTTDTPSYAPSQSGESTHLSKTQQKQAKRGQRGKAKKIAAKYRDQDEEDRAAVEALIGSAAGQKKAEAAAKVKAEREAAQEAAKERRRAQHQRQQRETAEYEEVRKLMLDEGVDLLDADEAEKVTPLDSLVGTPLPGDEILEAIPVCGPYGAIGVSCKYKAKLQPGSQKKGKAVKEIFDIWRRAAEKKNVVDENSQDKERMWPREVELIKAMKPEEAINAVPVRQLRVMMSGGSGGGGGSSSGPAKGKKGAGGKRKKK